MTQPNSRLQSIMEQQQRARARAAPGGSTAFPEGLVEWTRTCVDEWYRLYNRQQEAANVPIEALIEASQAGDGGPRADAATSAGRSGRGGINRTCTPDGCQHP